MSATRPDCPNIVEDVSGTHPRQFCFKPILCQDVLTVSQLKSVQGKARLTQTCQARTFCQDLARTPRTSRLFLSRQSPR